MEPSLPLNPLASLPKLPMQFLFDQKVLLQVHYLDGILWSLLKPSSIALTIILHTSKVI